MKTMTCRQLGGACDLEFKAETFEKMADLSKNHGREMFAKRDRPHLEAMEKMKEIMSDPQALSDWMVMKKREFDSLPDN